VDLLVDRSSIATDRDYWMAARQVTGQPGALVAVWNVDNLLIPEWRAASLDAEMALRWIECTLPDFLLVRAEFDLFFQIGDRGYTDLVRVPEAATDSPLVSRPAQ
jgi:hypothetical protein